LVNLFSSSRLAKGAMMQEWEAFFREKSARRSRARSVRSMVGWMIAAAAMLTITMVALFLVQSLRGVGG
jgi:hypothetical protein